MQPPREASLLLVNQVVSPLYMEMAEAVCEKVGTVALITGSSIARPPAGLKVLAAPRYNRRNLATRAWSWFSFLAVTFYRNLRMSPRPPLLVVSNPPMLPWLAALFNILFKQPFAVVVWDIYPEVLERLGWVRAGGLVARLWRRIDLLALGRADRIITIGRHMAQTLQRREGREQSQAPMVIPTWVDTDRIVPHSKVDNPFAREQGQVDKLTVLYSGNIGLTHDLGILLRAADALQSMPSIHFIIIGDGPGKAGVQRAIQDRRLRNVTLLPYQPEAVLSYSLSTADVAIVAMARGTEGVMMPSKTYFYMSAGAAIAGISCTPNDLVDVIEDCACGTNVSPDDAEGLVSAILQFRDRPEYLASCKRHSREAAVLHFSKAANKPKFVSALAPLWSGRQ